MVSFFKPSDTESVEIHEIVEGAKKYLENKVRIGDWSNRSIGWLRVDLDVTPELALADPAFTDQAIIAPIKHRMVHFRKLSMDKEDEIRSFAEIVRELTGDWLKSAKCDEI